MKDPKRYLVTAALPYANGPIHIGQLAGAYISPDIYTRYLRMKGEDVVFVCGSDEHGVAITLKALKEDTTPKAIIDKYHSLNKSSFEKFGIEFDIFHRTSAQLHHETASGFFSKLYEKGELTVDFSEQYYDEHNKLFLADRYIAGTCPKCGYENAYGDQCENCGSSLSPRDLINPTSTLSGNKPILKKTKHWYLPMDRYEDWLKKWILEDHKEWKKNVYGQCKSWLEQGLQPRAMTRDLDWGVKVPLDEADGKVLYVWLDAPIGYISATKEWARKNNRDWTKYWQDEDTRLLHFIGKDNIVFHCIIFPIILKAHGEYILPDNVPANEFMNMEGDKISTSRNWAVWLHEYLEEFPGKEDVLRYVLTANMPETKDSEFTWKDYQARNNNELVAILGNFINRTLVLNKKYFDSKVPVLDDMALEEILESDLLQQVKLAKKSIESSLNAFRFREALNHLMDLARKGNKYLTDTEPWKKIMDDEREVAKIIFCCLELIEQLRLLMRPFLPFAADKLTRMLSLDQSPEKGWDAIGMMPSFIGGHQLAEIQLLFEKVEDEVVQKQIEKLNATKVEESSYENVKPMISFEDFQTMDIRIGTISEAERIENTDKLLKLIVEVGNEPRTIVSGIADQFNTDEVIGKQVTVLLNLAPRKIKGVESQGMILMAENEEGKLALISPASAIENGAVVR